MIVSLSDNLVAEYYKAALLFHAALLEERRGHFSHHALSSR